MHIFQYQKIKKIIIEGRLLVGVYYSLITVKGQHNELYIISYVYFKTLEIINKLLGLNDLR